MRPPTTTRPLPAATKQRRTQRYTERRAKHVAHWNACRANAVGYKAQVQVSYDRIRSAIGTSCPPAIADRLREAVRDELWELAEEIEQAIQDHIDGAHARGESIRPRRRLSFWERVKNAL